MVLHPISALARDRFHREEDGTTMPKPSLLFVCLGNICRSPLAEAAFREAAARAGLDAEADSAGTGDWHLGAPPDRRARAEALRHGIDISGYRARQVSQEDFRRFSHILALDARNLDDLRAIAPANATADVSLLLDHAPELAGQSVADPYFGDESGFAETWREVSLAAEALVRELGR
jgi:protein-tyrosine phosphatase